MLAGLFDLSGNRALIEVAKRGSDHQSTLPGSSLAIKPCSF